MLENLGRWVEAPAKRGGAQVPAHPGPGAPSRGRLGLGRSLRGSRRLAWARVGVVQGAPIMIRSMARPSVPCPT